MEEKITPQQLVNLFLFDLCRDEAAFDDAPETLNEKHILNLKFTLKMDGHLSI